MVNSDKNCSKLINFTERSGNSRIISHWYIRIQFDRHLNSTLDGINLWPALSDDSKSDRNEILHNIDDIYGNAALTMGEWKVHKGYFNRFSLVFLLYTRISRNENIEECVSSQSFIIFNSNTKNH